MSGCRRLGSLACACTHRLSLRTVPLRRGGLSSLCRRSPVPLSPKVLDLLWLLASRPSQLVTKEDILRELWPDVAVTDNAITQAVSDLRQALGDNPAAPQICPDRAAPRLPVHRRGEVVAVRAIGVSAPASRLRRRPAKRRDCGLRFPERHRRRERRLDGRWHCRDGDQRSAIVLGSSRDRSRQPARGRACAARSKRRAPAASIFSSSAAISDAGDRLRITARVIEAATGEAVAHAKADGAGRRRVSAAGCDRHAVAPQPAGAVTSAAARRIGVRETSSLEAYRALTEGRLKLETLDPAHVPEAIRDFERAIALDPRYAQAYVGLAHAQFWLYRGVARAQPAGRGALRAAIAHGRRAIELDPGLGEAHAALAFLLASAGRHVRGARRRAARQSRSSPTTGGTAFGSASPRGAASGSPVSTTWCGCFRSSRTRTSGSAMVHVARRDLAAAEEMLRQGLAVQQRGATHGGSVSRERPALAAGADPAGGRRRVRGPRGIRS